MRLLLHLGLWLRLRLCLSYCLIESLLFFEEIALTVRALHTSQVIQVDHLFEVRLACVAVVGAESAAD